MGKTEHDQSEVAAIIGVHKSTTSGELQRNRGKHGYGYKQAHTKAIEQRKGKVNPRIDGGTWVFIETLIRKDWSSEHIHSWMKENMGVTVSHEWIYQYILQDKQTGGDLYTHLRCRKKEVELVTGLPSLREQAGKQIPLSVKDINKLWSH